MYNTSRMPRITRKKAKRSTSIKQKTVPTIRRDFDAFHAFLRTPRSEVEVRNKFKELFGKGKKLSRDHVATLLKMPTQKGGMAPLDYTLGSPDVRLSALPYVQRGFGFANMNSLTEGGAKEYLGMTPQMGGGGGGKRKSRTKQRGGGVADFAASVSAQPFLSSAPMTILQAGARLATGQVGLPSPHAEVNSLSIQPATYIQAAKLV
jgi:hypothetical protein